MKSKKMIPLMSAVTGILVLTMVILLFTIGPLKKSSEDKSLNHPGNGNVTESVEDLSSDLSETEGSSDLNISDSAKRDHHAGLFQRDRSEFYKRSGDDSE